MRHLITVIVIGSCLAAILSAGQKDFLLPKNHSPELLHVGTVESVYDGDTMTVMVDLGYDTYKRITVRLLDVDTPELRGIEKERGLVVRDAVRKLIDQHEVLVRNKGKGKYGRWLCYIYYDDPASGKLVNLSEYLLSTGMAERYE